MLDNYPPGVTGAEYDIAGPDSEHEGTGYCDTCNTDRDGMYETYDDDEWFVCDTCDNVTNL